MASGMRVLVVDDDPGLRAQLGTILAAGRHSVTNAASAREAQSTLESKQFDVMFTDLRMGEKGGMQLLADSHDRWPGMSVVMLTDRGSVNQAMEALRNGALDYLLKPIHPEQVARVLSLVQEQLQLRAVGSPSRDPAEYAGALAAEGAYEVLLISPPPGPENVRGVIHVDLVPENPLAIREAVKGFAASRERAAVVLAAVDELLARHREEDITSLLELLQTLLRGKGPLAVGYDPMKVSALGALAVRASLVTATPHTTLETLSSPIRRVILRRLADGPCSFTQAMEATQLDDTSKIAFHLRRLTESGLVHHTPGQVYLLSEQGTRAIAILNGIEQLDSDTGNKNRIFASQAPFDATS
jgi:CheY-like chemotaxis protein/DNA-binding HxlR family transcriptional regulator